MSAEGAYRAALLAALGTAEGLNGVYEAPPERAGEPWAELGDLLSFDWSTKDIAGRELRSTVTLRDRGDSPARLHDLAAATDAAVQAMPRDLGGWRIAGLVLVRIRIIHEAPDGWRAIIDHRARALAADP